MPSAAAAVLTALTVLAQEPKTAPASQPALELAATIALPEVGGRIDHLALDRRRKRLFVAALGNGSLEVVDLEKKSLAKSIGGLGEPQGVLCLEEAGKVCVADGGSGTLEIFDAATLEKVKQIKIGPDADNVRFDSGTKLVYVGFGGGGLAIVDTKDWVVAAEIVLGGHPESFQLDAGGKRAFVNVPSKREIEVVDLEAGKMTGAFPVREAEQNFPMAIRDGKEKDDRRLFVACRRPPKLLVLDPADGRTVAALELSGDADDLFLDEAGGKLFVACGEGFVDVFRRGEGGAFTRTDRMATAVGARTCLYAPAEETLFLAVPRRRDQGAEIRVYKTRP